jgi:hypothetical protein
MRFSVAFRLATPKDGNERGRRNNDAKSISSKDSNRFSVASD